MDSIEDNLTDYEDDDIFECETQIAELIGNAESQLKLEMEEESKGDRLSEVHNLLREINEKHQKLSSARKEKKDREQVVRMKGRDRLDSFRASMPEAVSPGALTRSTSIKLFSPDAGLLE